MKRHKGAAPVVMLRRDVDIAEQLSDMGFPQSEIEEIVERRKKGGSAFYNVERNIVVLLDTYLSNKQIKTILWYEAVHKVIRDMGITEEQMDYFFDLQSEEEKAATIEKLITAGYKESEFAEECLAYYIQDTYWEGKITSSDYNVISKLNDKAAEKDRKQIEFVQPIINSIVNGIHGFPGSGDTGRRRDGGEYDNLSENSKPDGEHKAIDGVLLHNSATEEGVEAAKRARRERRERRLADMRQAIEDVAAPLNVPVEVLESADELTGRMARILARSVLTA